MIRLRTRLQALPRDQRGAVAIEFALLGPIFIALLLGVLQIGIALQSYNAIRNVSADVARDVTVQYQTGNDLSNSQIRGIAVAQAISAPYLLRPQNVNITVVNAATQRIPNATELSLDVQYRIPTVMALFGFEGPLINYQRPIFVTND